MADKKMGRPSIYNADDLASRLNEFIDQHEEPFIQQFCLDNNINPDTLYRLEKDNKDLADAIKKAIHKQEVFLLTNAERNKINPTFAIFRLKQPQFGYTDKPAQQEQQEIKIILDTSGKGK